MGVIKKIASQALREVAERSEVGGIRLCCKYGHSARGNKISITLLKSAKFPDCSADMGTHEFTYSLLPHDGTAVSGETVKQANLLNMPPLVLSGKSAAENKKLFTVNSENVIIDAVKQADDGNGIILRLHECRGGKARVNISSDYDVSSFTPCNLLEEPTGEEFNGNGICADFNPFEIKSFIIK